MKKKYLVYSVLFGDYEIFSDHSYDICDQTELILFTDNENIKSEKWNIVKVTPRYPCDMIRSARYLKIVGPELFENYEASLYIDNTVLLKTNPNEFLKEFLSDFDIALPTHSFRDSVYAEFDAVQKLGYDDFTRVYEQLFHYQFIAADCLKEKPYWTAILLRKHNPKVFRAMSFWWDQITRYSRRDQLSINFTLFNNKLSINPILINNNESKYHKWPINVSRAKGKRNSNNLLDALHKVPVSKFAELDNENLLLKIENQRLISKLNRKRRAIRHPVKFLKEYFSKK